MTSNSKRSRQHEAKFKQAQKGWKLEQELYANLTSAKQRYSPGQRRKVLTPCEKCYLRGLLCGCSPEQIAQELGNAVGTVNDALAKGLYRYIEELLNLDEPEPVVKIGHWGDVAYLLERAGYKIEVSEPSYRLPAQKPTQLASLADIEEDNRASTVPHQNWGDVDGASVFFGRDRELEKLKQWIVQDRCQLVALLGIGGIGKTSLAVELAKQIQDEFEYVIVRSLQNAPPVEKILANTIKFLSEPHKTELPEDFDESISLLLNYLKQHRCLLVLDNAEQILQEGEHVGCYRDGYEGYGKLLKRVGKATHQSCLLVTSRELPKEIANMEGENQPVRLLQVSSLQPEDAEKIIQFKGLYGSNDEIRRLVERYHGHPLALELITPTIQKVFSGNISEFIDKGLATFNKISNILEWHFQRILPLEQQVMYWLAINRELANVDELRNDIVPSVSLEELIETIESLIDRSLIKGTLAGFAQHPVIVEYTSEKFKTQVVQEIKYGTCEIFNSHAIIKAKAKDYIRETQINLILKPIAESLNAEFGIKAAIEYLLKEALSKLQQRPKAGYATGNILNLLVILQIDLTNYDFSNLTIWQAFLRDVELDRVNFQNANLAKSVFAEIALDIVAIAFSPDGQLLAISDRRGEIHLWQVAERQILFTLKGHSGVVRSIAFSPDGQTVVSGSDDTTVKLWSIPTRQHIKTLCEHTNQVNSVAFSPDGFTLASGSRDKTIKLWDFHTGECRITLRGHTSRVRAVAFSPNSQLLASTSSDKTVRLWDVTSSRYLAILKGHDRSVYAVAFSPNGLFLASSSADKSIKLWDIQNVRHCKCLKTLEGHNSEVSSMAFSPDGKTLASGSYDKTVKLWNIFDVGNSRLLTTYQEHTSCVRSVAFSPDGRTLASSGDDRAVKLWDIHEGKCVFTWQGHPCWVYSVAFSPDGKKLASGSADKVVRLWDVNEGKCLATWRGHTEHIYSVAFSPDGKTLVSGSDDHTVKVWDVSNGKYRNTLEKHTHRVRSVAFSPQGTTLASSSRDRQVKLWDAHTGQCLSTFQEDTDLVYSVAFSPDGQMLASSSQILASDNNNYGVKLRDVTTGEDLAIFSGHEREINSIAFSPKGENLASGSGDNTVRLWDVNTHQCLVILQEHTGWVHSVAFSPDGKILASGSGDNTVRLWDAETHQCLVILQEHTGWVHSVAFSPDGSMLASGSADETIKIWDVKTGVCLKTILMPKPYQSMNITGVTGLSEETIATLKALGAIAF